MNKDDVFTIPSYIKGSAREIALLVAAALILIGLTAFSFSLNQRAVTDRETAEKLNRFNAQLSKFARMLRTVESSQRGFLLTGKDAFLQPYNEMSGHLVAMAKELQSRSPAELSAGRRITEFLPELTAKLREMQQTLARYGRGDREGAVALVSEGVGLTLTGSIEADLQAVRDEIDAVIRGNEAITSKLQSIGVWTDGIGAILILTFSFLSMTFLLRSNAKIKEAQDAIAKANAELETTVDQRTADLRRANEEIQRFAYIVSHDLRSPLVNIMGFTSELETLRKEIFDKLEGANALQGAEALSKDFDEAFGFIKSSIARMDRLINAILRISREGNRPLHPEQVEMNALVETLFSGLAHQIKEKSIAVEVGSLPLLTTDRLAIEQIFSNIIENAIKFSDKFADGEIKVDGQQRGNQVIYRISDNGRGIDSKDHVRIFELFRRSGPQNVPGEGMGLAHVTALVRRLGGTVEVKSQLGSGSTFTLTFPKALSVQKRIAA